MRAIQERLVDLIQADIYWIGGFTEAMKLAHYADSQGVQMCLHTGGNDPMASTGRRRCPIPR